MSHETDLVKSRIGQAHCICGSKNFSVYKKDLDKEIGTALTCLQCQTKIKWKEKKIPPKQENLW